jgi:NADPH:quinone reductase-like Zn-dependent oxidoreductase
MRAIVTPRFGSPEVLQIVERPAPAALPTEVVVRAKAVGLNPVDAIVRRGAFPGSAC